MKKEDIQSSQQGTGSSENRSNPRDEQRNQTTHLTSDQRKDMSQQAGLGRDRMTSIEEMGGLSGRDDYAGGDNDDMSNQNTNERTDR
jgi:hypothetical protein